MLVKSLEVKKQKTYDDGYFCETLINYLFKLFLERGLKV